MYENAWQEHRNIFLMVLSKIPLVPDDTSFHWVFVADTVPLKKDAELIHLSFSIYSAQKYTRCLPEPN